MNAVHYYRYWDGTNLDIVLDAVITTKLD